MNTQSRRLRTRGVIILGFFALFIFSGVFLLSVTPETPRVTASFISFTNTPPRGFPGQILSQSATNFALFSVSNHSGRLVHCIGFLPSRYSPQVIPLQAMEIQGGASVTVVIPPVTGFRPELSRLYFRRQDTAAEEAREMLDSVLKSIGIDVPSLNPDPLANIFSIPATNPPAAKTDER